MLGLVEEQQGGQCGGRGRDEERAVQGEAERFGGKGRAPNKAGLGCHCKVFGF